MQSLVATRKLPSRTFAPLLLVLQLRVRVKVRGYG